VTGTPEISELPRVVAAAPGKPVRPEAEASQRAAAVLAADPDSWTPGQAAEVVHRYTALAPAWDGERGGYRPVPLADALVRGGPFPPGVCLEVGCGTGLLTPLLAPTWPAVVSLDLTEAMLRRAGNPFRVLADAAALPVHSGQASAVVLADVPLFAAEVVRVLTPGGVVVWSNALGTGAPHHVPVPPVLDALTRASGTPWRAVTAEAGWGLWAVLRPAR
jgi:SAM-dependent methyltransferase